MGKTVALIMAAGGGERFEGIEPKTFYPLQGRPVLAWAIERFSVHQSVDSICIVVAPGEVDRVRDLVASERLAKVDHVVHGGSTRQESVWLGLESLDDTCETVLIHDAARPCLGAPLLDRVLEAVASRDAVVPVWPVVDTLVREEDGRVDAILDRVHISGVQTPQGFRTALLMRAHRRAKSDGLMSSDDGSLVFALGEPVVTVPGEPTNMKITYIEDAVIAEAILARRRG
ncbi:MAG: 2-C-methyl-D-erythritol 4-phosphate cytidylyltransferase [bacterium]